MLKTVHCAVLLGLVLMACTVGSATSSSSAVPQQQAEVTSPTSGLKLTTSIVAVTLGEECGGAGAADRASGSCAAASDAGADGGGGFAPAPGCGGTSYCQQSNVQIAFSAGAGSQAARIEIVRVELLDATGSIVDTLTASKPQAWNGNGYSPWDQAVKPAGDTKTSYDLTAPAWSKIDSNGTSRSYSAKYKLHVTLRIDGLEIKLESNSLSREPAVAT